MPLSAQQQLLEWAKKHQALSQSGKTYDKASYDLERYEQIEQISHEIFAQMANIPEIQVKELFLPEDIERLYRFHKGELSQPHAD